MIFQNAYTDEAQACMRMRKLGKGQSVVFCIPEEVKCSILELSGKHEKSDIDVSDVLRWAVSEVDKKGKKKKGTLGIGNGSIFFASESDKVSVVIIYIYSTLMLRLP